MKKGALFDMDGTLIDTEKLYRKHWQIEIEKDGYVFNPGFSREIAGVGDKRALVVINSFYPDEDAEDLKRRVHLQVVEEMKRDITEKPGMREILMYLKDKGVKLAVASSSTHEKINIYIEKCHLEGVFDALVSGYDIKRGKPEPDIFLKAAKAIGVSPEDCYVFEDSVNGSKAGNAAGCATVMIPDNVVPTKEERALCVGVYDSLSDALDAIKAGEI